MRVSPQVVKSMCLLGDESPQRRRRRNKNESIEDNTFRVLFSERVWLGSWTNPAGNLDSDTSIIHNRVDVGVGARRFWRFLIAGWTLCYLFIAYVFPQTLLVQV